jgi:hypothetical protein
MEKGIDSEMSDNKQAPGVLSIQEKVRRAEELYESWGSALDENPRIRALLRAMDRKVEASQKAMIDYGVVGACAHCDEEDGGSCCGAGIENRYSPALLLVNLLMGATLPKERLVEGGCYFLGARGCTLRARDVLCINYLCLEIQNMLTREDLITLQKTTGDELDTLFLLQETIKKHISQ